MDIIEYQVKVKHHEKAIQILDAIIALEKRQVNQKEWLTTPLGQWCSQVKYKHQIEITDMAIARLNQYYINHLKTINHELAK